MTAPASSCAVPRCHRVLKARGYCSKHYEQLMRGETPGLDEALPTWREELEQLAEGKPTPSKYARERARILAKERARQDGLKQARNRAIRGE